MKEGCDELAAENEYTGALTLTGLNTERHRK